MAMGGRGAVLWCPGLHSCARVCYAADASGPKHLAMTLTRSKLELLVADLLERTKQPCRWAGGRRIKWFRGPGQAAAGRTGGTHAMTAC